MADWMLVGVLEAKHSPEGHPLKRFSECLLFLFKNESQADF